MPNSKLTTEPCGGGEVWPFGGLIAQSICQSSSLPENFLCLDNETCDSQKEKKTYKFGGETKHKLEEKVKQTPGFAIIDTTTICPTS